MNPQPNKGRQKRKEGWLARSTYKKFLPAIASAEERKNIRKFAKKEQTLLVKNAARSFSMPMLAKTIEDWVERGIITEMHGRVTLFQATLGIINISNQLMRNNPELMKKVLKNPKIPINNLVKINGTLFRATIPDKENKKLVVVKMTTTGADVKVSHT